MASEYSCLRFQPDRNSALARTGARALSALIVGSALVGFQRPALGQFIRQEPAVSFNGMLAEDDQLSGIAVFQDLLVVCPDEGSAINILKKSPSGGYDLLAVADLDKHASGEIDMEGAASDAKYLYIVGSHSRARKKVEDSRSYKHNLKRLADVEERPATDAVFRLQIDDEGKITSHERISMRQILEADDILKRSCKIPSKENGIDIEGIAVKDERLYLGFRGPVLRENFVPILSLKFDEPKHYELAFVNLEGRGIRDMAAVDDGVLILAGSVGDGEESYRLYQWNGKDCIPGRGAPDGDIETLGDIPTPSGSKAEGLAVLGSEPNLYQIMIVYDGVAKGGPAQFNIARRSRQ